MEDNSLLHVVKGVYLFIYITFEEYFHFKKRQK
jgi:hypothetical protein